MERHRIKNADEFDELVNVLASAVGSLTNPFKLSKTFQSVKKKAVSANTIKKYIDYLEDAFLISKAIRYNLKGKRYIGSPAKFYFEDIGLRNARLDFRQSEENRLMENILYNELRYRGFRVAIGVVDAYEKDSAGKNVKKQYEIDFIATKGPQKFYLQSAFAMNSPAKADQERKSLRRIPDSFQKFIVVQENRRPRPDDDGFITVGIRQFLTGPDILR